MVFPVMMRITPNFVSRSAPSLLFGSQGVVEDFSFPHVFDQQYRITVGKPPGNPCYTPAVDQYAHQWLWDSGFHAMILSHYGPEGLALAKQEITTLLAGQWEDGFIAQIQFNTQPKAYKPGPTDWQTGHPTSGITQPPLIAPALRRIYEQSANKADALEFVRGVFPKVFNYHQWMHDNRMQDGLAIIVHPWESGTDNSPLYDGAREALLKNPFGNVNVPGRPDLKVVSADQRPKNEDYKVYWGLLRAYKAMGWDHRSIGQNSLFRVADPLFNAVWVKANEDLAFLAEKIGETQRARTLRGWQQETTEAMNNKLWDEKTGFYYAIDFTRNPNELIKIKTVNGLVPLYAGVPSAAQAARLIDHLENPKEFRTGFGVPSTARDEVAFEPQRYWQGASWPSTNYLVLQGTRRYAEQDFLPAEQTASRLTNEIKALKAHSGYREYYNSLTGEGCGADNFRWAALADIV